MKRALVAAIGALAFAGLGATGALAGEVKGPPGVPCGDGTNNPVCIHNTNVTGALDHARSACAASGLNDMDPNAGQTSSIVQTAADSWRYYGLPHGTPGVACRGNLG
jgi:hypothetical protein